MVLCSGYALHIWSFIQGKLLEGTTIQRTSVVECLMWERHHRILAVGWRSGEISVSNLEDTKDVVYEQSSVHRDAILFLCWNGSGSRLISGDQVWVWLVLQCVQILWVWLVEWDVGDMESGY